MRRARRLALGLSAAFFGSAPLVIPAQPATAPHLAFERLSQERGLSNGTVTALAQDRTGFLWLGTEDGLNRYGGAGFSVFRPVEGDTASLADGWITGLVVARDSTLWISTLHGGLQRFDPATERFRRYRHADADPRSLSSDRVNTVLEAHDGTIWTGTVRGLDHLDPATGRVRRYPLSTDSTALANDVLAIAEDAAGHLWIGGRTGLFLFDPARGTFDPVRDAVPWFPIRALHHDRRGIYWVATENALVAVDPATRRVVTHYSHSTPAHASPIDGRVLTLGDALDGTLWIGSDGGLASLDPATGVFHRYGYRRGDPHSLGGGTVRSVLVDRGNVLWAGLESYGVSKHAPFTVHFDVLRHDPRARASLSDGYVRGITQDRAGNLWIATQFGGLNRRDAHTGRITTYRHREDDPTSLPGDNVWAMYEDRSGTTWVGLYGNGFGTFDPRTGAFTRSPLVPAGACVNLIVEDRAGRLLLGLEGGGLIEISADRQHTRTWGATRGTMRTLVNDDVQTILEDRTGMLWVGGVDGLTRLDRSTGRTWHYRGVPGRTGALGTDFVTDVMEDSRGTVWVATKGAGVARYDARTDRFTSLGVANGIPHRFVYGILEDALGRLWLSTDDGLATLDPRTNAVARFGLADGLQAREFNRRAFYRGADGTMYFGGVNGMNSFRPDDVAPAPPPPPVAIVSLQPAGAPLRHLVRHPLNEAVTLSHDETAFGITYAALDFTTPEKIRYAYRLDGVDRDWVIAGDRREASYASVRPGRYVFHVIAANAAGVWNPTGATVTVIISPPWWDTWWARLLGVLGVAGLIAAITHLRLLAVHRQSAQLAHRVEEQTRDLVDAQTRLRDALEREREAARELFDITAAVPGAVFQLRETRDGVRSFSFVSEGVAPLYEMNEHALGSDDPRRVAERLVASVHPDDVQAMTRALARSRDALMPWHGEFRSVAADGTERWLAVQARPSREVDGGTVWTGVLTDATPARRAAAERAALEARVLQAQKAESLTVLAGGIAHDFNNLLVGVLANADLLRDEVADDSHAVETVSLIRASAMRAAELTQQMLAYAGRGRLVIQHVDLTQLVPDMLALVRSAVPRTIAFDVRTPSSPVPVEADATQLRQVVMNLATNAAEAIGDRAGGGRVTVRVGIEQAPQRELALQHASDDMPSHGPYAMIEVADDGCGMDATILGRIFDPFYSTKFTGRGLGLAALLGVVRAHHGGLRVATAPGRGARFTLYLPLALRTTETPIVAPIAPTASTSPKPSAPVTARGARVLVVDDEPAVLRTAARILSNAGHDVETAIDGAAAVERLAGAHDIDVVLMDMTMPRMNGLQAVEALRTCGIDVPVILMSGYSADEIAGHGPSASIDGFLKKPFASVEMRSAVDAVVARSIR